MALVALLSLSARLLPPVRRVRSRAQLSKPATMGKKSRKQPAGAPVPAESEFVRPLAMPELVEKLNTVPVFKVVDEETGEIVPTPDKGGTACICWYADYNDVQVALAIVKHREPERKVAIGTAKLGTALAMSEGWGTGMPEGPLRLQASNTVLRAVKEDLEPLPEKLREAMNPRTSAFPLFLMEELQSPSISPVFFRREDLVTCWKTSGRSEESMPNTLVMYDLRVLVVKMMSTAADWRSLMFVAPQTSIDVIDQSSQHPLVRELEHQAAISQGDEPPPLEATANA